MHHIVGHTILAIVFFLLPWDDGVSACHVVGVEVMDGMASHNATLQLMVTAFGVHYKNEMRQKFRISGGLVVPHAKQPLPERRGEPSFRRPSGPSPVVILWGCSRRLPSSTSLSEPPSSNQMETYGLKD
jgi:hypothetical protein